MSDDTKKNLLQKANGAFKGLSGAAIAWIFFTFPTKEVAQAQINEAKAEIRAEITNEVAASERRTDKKLTEQMESMNKQLDRAVKLLIEIKTNQ